MAKNNKIETLADKISSVLTTAPSSFDPEDDAAPETSATVTENVSDNSEENEVLLSKFRKQNIDLLEDVDVKYAGKKSSRKNLRGSDSEGDEYSLQDENDSSYESSTEGSELQNHKSGSASEDESVESDEDTSGGFESDDAVSVGESSFEHIQKTDVSHQLRKGVCVRNQLNIWESLLEVRIQLQKCLITANKMPQEEAFVEIKAESEEQFTNKVAETKKTVSGALDKLLQLQTLLLKQYPESKLFFKIGKGVHLKNENDEEIPSDIEEEMSIGNAAKSDEEVKTPKKKRKLADYEEEIAENHKRYKEYRNSVIQKWNDKTRIGLAKSNPVHSVLNQIEHNLSDKDKLVKRTQTKRSEYKVIGQKELTVDREGVGVSEECDAEIFDDDDFYHQLLRELIEVKSAEVTDPVQLGRQWIQLQNLRSKMKRKIDTRATKGRKIRYAVHSKLVNFMAPIDKNSWTDEAKTELFGSLFGKNQPLRMV